MSDARCSTCTASRASLHTAPTLRPEVVALLAILTVVLLGLLAG